MRKVFDASAVLAFLYNQPGSEKVRPDLPLGVMSAVNAAEALTVLLRNGVSPSDGCLALAKTGLTILDFSWEQAIKAAELVSPQFRSRGISLGDRACMAVAVAEKLPAVTADRRWSGLSAPGLRIELIRG